MTCQQNPALHASFHICPTLQKHHPNHPLRIQRAIMARAKNNRTFQKRVKRTEVSKENRDAGCFGAEEDGDTTAQTVKKPAKKNAVCRDYDFEDGDDQMWHAKWCLDSWCKPGSKTLLLFQWDCQDEPTWEPYEGHNEDSCLAADFFHWVSDSPRPAGWKPPTGWSVPDTRPPIEWFEAKEAARREWPQLWQPETLETKLRSLEPRGRQQKAPVRARPAGNMKIKAHGAKKVLVRDSRRSTTSSPTVDSLDERPSLSEIESTWGLRKGKGRS
ncbi:hypothetical protein IWX90DRAFT_41762 [Phyllosticta citrichinensis]|uniref:Chromo domain-containing protein n=1 Tax=Phyllosticta citrichinensis TaxID=1130410 RepID=A0ABR1Y913_9PEZI